MPWLYNDPATLNYDQVDEAIRGLCQDINQSTWLRTEESCSGHPDWLEQTHTAWPGMMDAYLRLCIIQSYKPDRVKALLYFVDKIRQGMGKMPQWYCPLEYDRSDELGTHWFMKIGYAKDLGNRSIALDMARRYWAEIMSGGV